MSGLPKRLRRIGGRLAEAARVLETEVGRGSDGRCKLCGGRRGEGHYADYADDSQPCAFAVVERVISDLAELAAEQTEAPAAGERCTGLTAVWCPVHGDCTCALPENPEDGDRFDFDRDSPNCPLHGDGSDHAAAEVALACEPPAAGELPAGWEAAEAAAWSTVYPPVKPGSGAILAPVGLAVERVLAAIKPLWTAPPPPAAWEAIETGVRKALPCTRSLRGFGAVCEGDDHLTDCPASFRPAVLSALRSVELASLAKLMALLTDLDADAERRKFGAAHILSHHAEAREVARRIREVLGLPPAEAPDGE